VPDGEDPTTRELRIRQAERESLERRHADREETDEHVRRADKAAYLREKLEERADAESDD
jgi:hypothetical protein